MIITEQILNRKIMQNEAQYDLDRKAAKISALSSNKLDKHEYLTGGDLGLKPSSIEQTNFEYSPLGKMFSIGLNKKEKDIKEGLFKRLKNIEDKNEELLKAKKKTKNIKEVTDSVDQPLSLEAKELIEEVRVIWKDDDYRKLKIRGGNNTDFDFSDYKTFKELFRELYYKKITIHGVERKQDGFNAARSFFCTPRNNKYTQAKNKPLINAKKFYEGRQKIIEGFKDEIFPFNYDEVYDERMWFEREEKKEKEEEINNIRNKNGLIDYEKLMRKIGFKERNINSELAKKYFFTNDLGNVLKNLKSEKLIKKKKTFREIWLEMD